MSMEITILDETKFTDRSMPLKPVPSILITFQTQDGRVGSVQLPEEGFDTKKRNEAIKAAVKAMKPRTFERVKL